MNKELIEEKALDHATDYSGGVLRTMSRLISTSAVESKILGGKKIGQYDMEKGVKREQIKMRRGLTRTHWELLVEIYDNKEIVSDRQEEKFELLQGLFALEYINGEEWYNINPLLEKSIQKHKEKYIKSKTL
jgi:hypothetical protein